jgi:hypothetical protein
VQHDRNKSLLTGIFLGIVFVLLAGCSTTGSATLGTLTDHQADTAIVAERIAEGSATVASDLRAIEQDAGSLEPVIRKVRVKAEKLETDTVALTKSLAAEREITGKARDAVAETEKQSARYERQRNTLGGIAAGIILVIVAGAAFMFIKKRG